LAVGAAMLAHSAGNGNVDAAGAAWAFALLAGPAWWLGRRERGWGVIALTQLAAQQLAHLALSASGGEHAGHLVSADLMLYAHLAAAALAASWLRLGERRAWAAAYRFLLVLAPMPAIPPGVPSAPPIPRGPVRRPGEVLLRHALARRGPPLPA
jgi:hypothetical protein